MWVRASARTLHEDTLLYNVRAEARTADGHASCKVQAERDNIMCGLKPAPTWFTVSVIKHNHVGPAFSPDKKIRLIYNVRAEARTHMVNVSS